MITVVSLVPSWTETLIAAGVPVIGRTRFCIHPEEMMEFIPAVGGTKDVDWDKVQSYKPDFVLFDKEENTLTMAKDCPVPWIATHVQSMQDMPKELLKLGDQFRAPQLYELAKRWEKVIQSTPQISTQQAFPPALIEWIKPLTETPDNIIYVIWKNPWMAAGHSTFIGSVLEWFGLKIWNQEKYPEFTIDDFKQSKNLFLCSSEPYPFAKRRDAMMELPGAVALVDGEKLSWFGIRSLEFLESFI